MRELAARDRRQRAAHRAGVQGRDPRGARDAGRPRPGDAVDAHGRGVLPLRGLPRGSGRVRGEARPPLSGGLTALRVADHDAHATEADQPSLQRVGIAVAVGGDPDAREVRTGRRQVCARADDHVVRVPSIPSSHRPGAAPSKSHSTATIVPPPGGVARRPRGRTCRRRRRRRAHAPFTLARDDRLDALTLRRVERAARPRRRGACRRRCRPAARCRPRPTRSCRARPGARARGSRRGACSAPAAAPGSARGPWGGASRAG